MPSHPLFPPSPPPISRPGGAPSARRTVWLSSAYLGPVEYYAHIYAATDVVLDEAEHYVKQTYRNRCYIATPTGPQALTLPVERDGAGRTPVRELRLSDHGNWRHLHWTALVSAYEKSPYFEYYADDFRPLYERKFSFLADFNETLRRLVLSLLDLERPTVRAARYEADPAFTHSEVLDLRRAIAPKSPPEADPAFTPVPYYQVFASRTGFLPNLSIADLLFNLGPESRLVLRRCLPQAESSPSASHATPPLR